MKRLSWVFVAVLAACGQAAHPASSVTSTTTMLAKATIVKPALTVSGLQDWGGPIVTAANVHVLWWGATFPDQATFNSFMPAFVGSNYVNVANEYERGGIVALTLANTSYDTTSEPAHNVRANGVGNELKLVFGTTLDPNGVYIVLGDTYGSYGDGGACAWHDYFTNHGANIPIEYVPNDYQAGTPSGPAQCAQAPVFPTDRSAYGKEVANRVAHETLEAITDPMPCTALTTCTVGHGDPAWDGSDTSGGAYEIADLCVNNYSTITLPDSSQWSLQGEWSNATNGCVWGS